MLTMLFFPSTARCFTSIAPSLLPHKLKRYKSVKSVAQYNYIIKVLKKWGDDAFLKDALPTDPDANEFRAYRKENYLGYNYVKQYVIEEAESLGGTPKIILKRSLGVLFSTCWTYLRLSTKLIANKAI